LQRGRVDPFAPKPWLSLQSVESAYFGRNLANTRASTDKNTVY
jgi:hypothetical protein